MRASFSLLWTTAWAFQKREANSAEQQNINQASCKLWLRSILSHWSEMTQSIIQNALMSAHRSSGSKLESISQKNGAKHNEISGGGVRTLGLFLLLPPHKLCRAFSYQYSSLTLHRKHQPSEFLWGKNQDYILMTEAHLYTHRKRQTSH